MLKANKLDVTTLLLRIAAGWIFIFEGHLKLLILPRAGLTSYFAAFGFPFPEYTGLAIGFLEFCGGILLLAGFLTRPLGFIFAAEMLVAIIVVHLPEGFGASLEVASLLFFIGLSIGIIGGGVWSLDNIMKTLKHVNTKT